MTNYLLLLLNLLILLFSCTPLTVQERDKRDLIHSFSKEIKQTKNIYFSLPNFSLDHKNNFDLLFFSYHLVNTDEARRLLVESVEEFILYVNNFKSFNYTDQSILEYSSLAFAITFINKDGDLVKSDHIAMIMLDNGVVHYGIYDPQICQFRIVFGEPYKKALGIVEHQKNIEQIVSLENTGL